MVAPVAYGDISQQEADMIGAAASWLPDYVRTASNFRQLCRDSVVAGSPAQELIGLGFETGDGQAALRGIVADDYLMGTCQLLSATTGLTNFTLYAAIRGAFESDAMICWLLEPGLSALLRAARMFVLRLRLQKQNEKFAPFKAFASERRAVIHEQAAELGLSVKAETVAGEQLPTMTALVKQLLPDLG
ncbi:MAG TPA: hypothetical protein VGZ22_01700, partial [Isosphaeraceae bacterium]|nr:hypothetical protein [Isosphaeraceae bacterium]